MITVTAVTLTRPRHPFEGRSLRVLGSMRRHGVRELLVVLPDGSKRLIPAAWTDLGQAAGPETGDGPGTLGISRGPAGSVGAGFGSFCPEPGGPGAGCTKPTCQGG